MIVGLTGLLGSGKGTVAEYFVNKGFEYTSCSDELRRILKEEGKNPEDRNLLIDKGNSLREKYGPNAIAEILGDRIDEERSKGKYENVIVDSIRNPAEVHYLQKEFDDFYLIGISAPQDLRWIRIQARKREGDPKTWEDFLKIDSVDQGKGEKSTGQQVRPCLALATHALGNEAGIDEFERRIRSLYDDLMK